GRGWSGRWYWLAGQSWAGVGRRAVPPGVRRRPPSARARTIRHDAAIGRHRYVHAHMSPAPADRDTIHHADNMDVLPTLPAEAFQLVYIDPPFNTGATQSRRTLAMEPDAGGDRTGFKGVRYRTRLLAESRYRDTFEDYLSFLEPRLRE